MPFLYKKEMNEMYSYLRTHFITIAFGFLAAASSEAAQGPGPGGAAPPPPAVSYIITETTTVPITYEYVGVTEASKKVEIRARIQGFIESRNFEEGAMVKEGDLLFTIDRRSFEADVEIASARVEQAQARRLLAESELKRLREAGERAVSASNLDKAQMEFDEARASLRLAQAELAKTQLELSYTKIYAPLTGLIGKAMKEEGSLVDESANSLLAAMTQIDPIYVSFSISEKDYLAWQQDVAEGRIRPAEGQDARYRVVLQDGSLYAHEGVLNFRDPAFNPETGTYQNRATFANPERMLRPGQFVKIRMLGWVRPDTIAVPQKAVTQIPSGAFVIVIDDENMTDMRRVTLGPWLGNQWVISEGLKPGERVVVEGTMKAQPGMKVNPVRMQEATQEIAVQNDK